MLACRSLQNGQCAPQAWSSLAAEFAHAFPGPPLCHLFSAGVVVMRAETWRAVLRVYIVCVFAPVSACLVRRFSRLLYGRWPSAVLPLGPNQTLVTRRRAVLREVANLVKTYPIARASCPWPATHSCPEYPQCPATPWLSVVGARRRPCARA